ncbi:7-cyano-7-deazaguanine synthase [Pseudomonadota bacterium]
MKNVDKMDKRISKLLKKKQLEDLDTIRMIEKILITKRGFVFKMPKPKSPIVLQLSGGIDTVSMIVYLIKKYDLVVYPLFIRRGQARVKKEEDSVDFFNKIFLKKYPDNYRNVFKIETRFPPMEIRKTIIRFADKKVSNKSIKRWGIPMFASLLTSFSVEYAFYIEHVDGLRIRTIFCAAVDGDGDYVAHHSLTGLRGVMLNICTQTQDFSWQFTSPFTEPAIGVFGGKEELIRWGHESGLPIHKSWSCYLKNTFHCGQCDSCSGRRAAFNKSGIEDKTVYISDLTRMSYVKKIVRYYMERISEEVKK